MANARALEALEPGGVGRRFLDKTQPSLEAQLCNLADEIAYNAHDIDDGVRSGLITLTQLTDVPLFDEHRCATLAEYPDLAQPNSGRRLLYETIRRMLSAQIYDLMAATSQALQDQGIGSVEAVRQAPPLVRFSERMAEQSQGLKRFLFSALYRHPQVMATTTRASEVVQDLFRIYSEQPTEMQADFAAQASVQRAVVDYIAGMTDRFALREHERLTGIRWQGGVP